MTGAEPCGDVVVRFFLNSIDVRLPLRATLSFVNSPHEIPPALVYREDRAERKRMRRLMTRCSIGAESHPWRPIYVYVIPRRK